MILVIIFANNDHKIKVIMRYIAEGYKNSREFRKTVLRNRRIPALFPRGVPCGNFVPIWALV